MTTKKFKSLGELIKAYRLGEKMTQVEFATFLDVSRQRLRDIEHDRYSVSIHLCKTLAKQLDLPLEWLVKISIQKQFDDEGINLKVS